MPAVQRLYYGTGEMNESMVLEVGRVIVALTSVVAVYLMNCLVWEYFEARATCSCCLIKTGKTRNLICLALAAY